MMSTAFRIWLEDRRYAANTIASRVAGALRIESFYGDLDKHYASNTISVIDSKLVYSTDDERAGRPNPSSLPITGRLRTNLATYRSAIALYRRFRDSTAAAAKAASRPTAAAQPKVMTAGAQAGAMKAGAATANSGKPAATQRHPSPERRAA